MLFIVFQDFRALFTHLLAKICQLLCNVWESLADYCGHCLEGRADYGSESEYHSSQFKVVLQRWNHLEQILEHKHGC